MPLNGFCTKSEYCYGYTVEGVDFRFYVPSDNFLMLQLSSEDLKLVNIFSKALGYQPCCRYNNDVGFFVFEWVKKGENERLTELIEEARKGKIIQLRSFNSERLLASCSSSYSLSIKSTTTSAFESWAIASKNFRLTWAQQ